MRGRSSFARTLRSALAAGAWLVAITAFGACGDIVIPQGTDTAGGDIGGGTSDGGTSDGGPSDGGTADTGCTSHAACDDGDPCTQDVCGIDGACAHPPAADGTLCDDGDGQTVNDACQAGVCAGTVIDCTDLDKACVVGVFDSGAGKCVAQLKDDGTACDDGDASTANDVCTGGVCAGGGTDCSGVAVGPCEVAVFDAGTGQCVGQLKDDGTACDDGDPATANDVCTGGVCAGVSTDCSAFPVGDCEVAMFDAGQGQCVAQPADDGTACSSVCGSGTCTAGACVVSLGVCDDGDPCTIDTCLASGCQHEWDPMCTTPTCGNGVCDTSLGENATNCPGDCGGSGGCGDGVCDTAMGEDVYTCGLDCGELTCATPADCPPPLDPCMVASCSVSVCVASPGAPQEVAMGVVAASVMAGASEINSSFLAAHPSTGSDNAMHLSLAVHDAPSGFGSGWLTGNDEVGYEADTTPPADGLFDVGLSVHGTKTLNPLVTGAFDWWATRVSKAAEDGSYYFAVRATDPAAPLLVGDWSVDTTGAASYGDGLYVVGMATPEGGGAASASPLLGVRRFSPDPNGSPWARVDEIRRGASATGALPAELFVNVWANEGFELFVPGTAPGDELPLGTFGVTGADGTPPPGGARYVVRRGNDGQVAVWPAYWPASDGYWSKLVPLPATSDGLDRFVLVFQLDPSSPVNLSGWEGALDPNLYGVGDTAVVYYEDDVAVRALGIEGAGGMGSGLWIADAATDGETVVLTGQLGGADLMDLSTGELLPSLPLGAFALSLDVSQQSVGTSGALTPLASLSLTSDAGEVPVGLLVDGAPGYGFAMAVDRGQGNQTAGATLVWASLDGGGATEMTLDPAGLGAFWLVGMGPGGPEPLWAQPLTDSGVVLSVQSLAWTPDGRVALGGDFDNGAGSLQLHGTSLALPGLYMEFMDIPAAEAQFGAVLSPLAATTCGN